MTIEQATIKGAALSVKATGGLDGSGKVKRATFNLEAGLLDLDRYLPPPADTAMARRARTKRHAGDPMAAIPDEPFDLSGLKGTEADIKISIGGVKARGFRLGRIGFAATLKGGVLNAALQELRLYGGNVSGKVKADGSGSALGIDAEFDVAKVDVGALARAAQGGEAKVAGIATASLSAKGQGRNPRALVQGLVASAKLSLGGIDVRAAPGTLTKLDLAVDLPGVDASPSVAANLVYNKEPVAISAKLDPLPKVLSGKKFKAELAVDSKRLKLNYTGTVQAQPVPGLAGKFGLDVPSVGGLLAWVGSPLPKDQPDPGPLKVSATLAADGPKASLEQATIDGKALKATMTASVDGSAAVKRFDANVEIIEADLNAYLPEQKDKKKTAKKKSAKGSKPAGWSEDPIDLSGLHTAEGQAKVKIGRVRYGDLDIEGGTATLTLAKGVLKAAVAKLQLAKGTIDFNATIDGSAASAAIDYQLNVAGVQARPILKTFAGTDRLSGATALQASGRTKGANVKQLVSALNGKGGFSFKDGAIHGINIAKTLRNAGSFGFGDSSAEKTDFAELSGSFTIADGVVDNRDFKMQAPLVRLAGAGKVPMPPRTVDYTVEAKIVASLKGQGGGSGFVGLPIPVKITGLWDDPSYGVDWKSVLLNASTDPSRIANLPDNLVTMGKGMGIKIPGLSTITGTAGSAGSSVIDKVLKVLPSLPGTQQKQPATSTEQKPAEEKAPSLLSPLKKLFGN
ncbi:MAG: AsmA family protein [Alphaproteobacteria bacterium]|nr:AsmA family protein [Alphaproteobacteria bacterium]